MARIAGIDLQKDKRVEIGLTSIYGVGRPMSNTILSSLNIDPNTRVKDLTEGQVISIAKYIDANLSVEGDLQRERQLNIKRLIDIGCYRGVRHRKGLPVRGQSTKQNARTCKGPKRTVGRKKEKGKK